jgi:hypothetical protein
MEGSKVSSAARPNTRINPPATNSAHDAEHFSTTLTAVSCFQQRSTTSSQPSCHIFLLISCPVASLPPLHPWSAGPRFQANASRQPEISIGCIVVAGVELRPSAVFAALGLPGALDDAKTAAKAGLRSIQASPSVACLPTHQAQPDLPCLARAVL